MSLLIICSNLNLLLFNYLRKGNVPRATVPQKSPCIKAFPFQFSSDAFLTATTAIISIAIISSTLCMFTELYVYVYRIICVCLHNYMCMFTGYYVYVHRRWSPTAVTRFQQLSRIFNSFHAFLCLQDLLNQFTGFSIYVYKIQY